MSKEEDKRLKKAIARMNAVRDFPNNTTPAARHVQMLAETLAQGEKYHMVDEDPQHVAESLISVLTGFYEMSTALDEKKAMMVEVAPLQWIETHDGSFVRAETPGGRVYEFPNGEDVEKRKAEAEERHRKTVMSMLKLAEPGPRDERGLAR